MLLTGAFCQPSALALQTAVVGAAHSRFGTAAQVAVILILHCTLTQVAKGSCGFWQALLQYCV